jgi:hypothetical protein
MVRYVTLEQHADDYPARLGVDDREAAKSSPVRKLRTDRLSLEDWLLENLRAWEREGPACRCSELGRWRRTGSTLPDAQAHRDPKSRS